MKVYSAKFIAEEVGEDIPVCLKQEVQEYVDFVNKHMNKMNQKLEVVIKNLNEGGNDGKEKRRRII